MKVPQFLLHKSVGVCVREEIYDENCFEYVWGKIDWIFVCKAEE